MKLIQKHLIKRKHKFYREIDRLAFLSKNLFNCGIYLCRQAIFKGQKRPNYYQLYQQLKSSTDYKALPAKVSQQVLMQVDRCFKSYEQALLVWFKTPSQFTGKPKLPKYQDKIKGRNLLVYTIQAISQTELKKGLIKLSKTNLVLPTSIKAPKQVRLVPVSGAYKIEIIYEKPEEIKSNLDGKLYAGLDLGVNNLATLVSNTKNFKPLIICGKALKACNQKYNKVFAKLQSLLPQNQYSSKKIEGLTLKRNNKVDYYLHTASSYIIEKLVEHHIGTLIVGKNEGWKQSIGIGKKNNQNFVNIPHCRLIEQLEYKASLVGIKVVAIEESYTSKCSFLDLEPIKKSGKYLGKRIKRGLFRSSNQFSYNADCNGAGNILRKVVGNSLFSQQDSIERCVVHPVRVKAYKIN